MGYSMPMAGERPPKRKKLLPEGWRVFTILDCKPSKSKAGNEMFIFTIKDTLTGYEEDIYAVATPGKRWFLKCLLTAIGNTGGEDGVYEWDIPEVINKEFRGLVEHDPNDYINRDGEEVKAMQHRISDVKPLDEPLPPADDWGPEQQQEV
jgi:hypothetical protein